MNTIDLLIGESHHFSLYPLLSTVNLAAYTGVCHVVSPYGDIVEIPIAKSPDNTHFEVKVDTSELHEHLYELRVFITDTVIDFTKCAYKEKLNIKR